MNGNKESLEQLITTLNTASLHDQTGNRATGAHTAVRGGGGSDTTRRESDRLVGGAADQMSL